MNYNFDEVIRRGGTGSLKYDAARARGKPEGLIPMWVADMDFRSPPEVVNALLARVEHGVFGYSEHLPGYFEILRSWAEKRYRWSPDPSWRMSAPGVVFAAALAVKAFTHPGEGVLIQRPVYYPFTEIIEANGRKAVNNPLRLDEATGKYRPDFEDFERKIRSGNAKLFILCNPHNPVGRVWTEAELVRIGEICSKYGVIILSDEIHADFIYPPHRHRVLASIDGGRFANRCVVCLSPSKTFNLAGLQYADIFVPDPAMRARMRAELAAAGVSQAGTFGITAARAAYKHGGPWVDALLKYLAANVAAIKEFADKYGVFKFTPPEGTYLAWLDFRALNLPQERLDEEITRAGLWLDGGAMFGAEGRGFQRLNFACPRGVLARALNCLRV